MPEAEKKYYRNLAREVLGARNRILCPENGCDLWAYFHPGAEDQVGKLQQRRESQLQLEAGVDAAREFWIMLWCMSWHIVEK